MTVVFNVKRVNMFNRFSIFIFVLTLIIYLFFAGRFQFNFPKTNRDYFTQLSSSFLSGKLDIPYPGYTPNDLSYYNSKYYLYWGSLPAVILTPIVFLFGTNISDIFYTALFGAVNVLLMYFLLIEFKQFIRIKATNRQVVLLTFCFAFGTIHFYLSILGTVWFTSQIVALTMFIISLLFLFKYLNKNQSKNLIFSIFFLGFASLGKYTFLMSIPLYIGLLYREHKLTLLNILRIFAILIIFIIIILGYNMIRFASLFDNGLKLMAVNPRFYQDIKRFGYFNIYYILGNLYYFLLNPTIPDPNGNSIFVTSPIFILIVYGIYKKYYMDNKFIFRWLFITSIMIMLPVLLYYGGGWYQFGYRYGLDIYPLLFLLLLLVINKYNKYIVYTLGILSVIINLYGAFWMIDFAKHAYF